ncbi:TPA: TrbC/VirB2 family protein [Legionella pneumophila]
MIQFFKNKAAVVNEMLLLVLCTVPSASHAASIETILRKSATYLQGPVAKGAGLLAILGTGYLTLFTQKMPKEQFVMILVGLGIIFGGSSLYSSLIG